MIFVQFILGQLFTSLFFGTKTIEREESKKREESKNKMRV
jgi:hypothetical protein